MVLMQVFSVNPLWVQEHVVVLLQVFIVNPMVAGTLGCATVGF